MFRGAHKDLLREGLKNAQMLLQRPGDAHKYSEVLIKARRYSQRLRDAKKVAYKDAPSHTRSARHIGLLVLLRLRV